MRVSALIKPVALGLTALASAITLSNAQAAPITWNGWTFDYEVGGSYQEGLILKNVKYQAHTLLKKVSLPAVNEYGANPGASDTNPSCGTTVHLDSTLTPMPWANNATVSQRQFNFAGRQWYEIGIYKKIDLAEYFQAYYLSADGLLDMRLYSKGINCVNYFNARAANWRVDVDVDDPANDRLEAYTNKLQPVLNELDTPSSATHVRDLITNNVVNIFASINNFNHPDGTVTLSDENSVSQDAVLYRASEDIGWSATSNPSIYASNAENINGKDVVRWPGISIELPNNIAENNVWRAMGVSLAPSWVPNYLPDVVVDSVGYSEGQFTVKITNRGIAPTPAGKAVGVGFLVDGVYKTWLATSSLMPGESRNSTTYLAFYGPEQPYLMPNGNHTITAWVDDINRFPESDETNNQLSTAISLSGPDTINPYIAINSRLLVENGPFTNYNISNSTVIMSATAFDNVAIKNVSFTLDQGGTATTLFTKKTAPYVYSWDSTTVAQGFYNLTATATDTSGNQSSNTVVITVVTPASIQRPDLVVTNVAYSIGKFTATIKNNGTADIPAAAWMGFSYYVDGVYKTWTSTYGPLAAGESKTLGMLGAPFIIPSGSHTIKVIADDQSSVAEANETNNQLSQTITVP